MKTTKVNVSVHPRDVVCLHETNTCRQTESLMNSQENRKLIVAFTPVNAIGGWSVEHMAVMAPMSNWLFSGTAEEALEKEMLRRQTMWDSLKKVTTDTYRLKAFEEIYVVDGKLYQPKLKTAYWVSSGHQRFFNVIVPAYAEQLRRLDIAETQFKAVEAMCKERGEAVPEKVLPGYSFLVPSILVEYESLKDCIEHQLAGNERVGVQSRLTILDHIKTVRGLIGNGHLPGINESQYRSLCAKESLKEGAKGEGNSGGMPRQAFCTAIIDYTHPDAGLLAGVFAPEKLNNGGVEVENSDWIPIKALDVMNQSDPMGNASVVARLVEPGLLASDKYLKKFADKASEIEKAINARKTADGDRMPWSLQETKAWVETRKPHNPNNFGTVYGKAPAKKAKSPDEIKAIAVRAPSCMKQVLLDIADGEDAKIDEVFNSADLLNAAYALRTTPEVVNFMKLLTIVRDADKTSYEALVTRWLGEIQAMINSSK